MNIVQCFVITIEIVMGKVIVIVIVTVIVVVIVKVIAD